MALPELSDAELERYARHIALPDVGGLGQRRLKAARVAMVGVGGLGCAALPYLVAAGVGQLTLIDDDRVALSNLQRQILFRVTDIGAPKVHAATAALTQLNPHVTLTPHAVRLTAENALTLLADHDLILDGCDSFATRLLVADTALALGCPLISAAVGPMTGQIGVFKGQDRDLPCYRCLVPDVPDRPALTCADQGILGALVGVMGSLQALETIREITAFAPSSAGSLTVYKARSGTMRTVALHKDPACCACGNRA